MHTPRSLIAAVLLVSCAAGCASLDYDLSTVPLPISAKPADSSAAEVVPFTIEEKNILWVHGLGRSQPDVAALVSEAAHGYDRIAGFRVTQGAAFHDWLVSHLSLTLVRMKSVVIEGQLVRDR